MQFWHATGEQLLSLDFYNSAMRMVCRNWNRRFISGVHLIFYNTPMEEGEVFILLYIQYIFLCVALRCVRAMDVTQ